MALQIRKSPKTGFDERWFEYSEGIKFKIASIDRDGYQIGRARALRLQERKEVELDLHNLQVDLDVDRTDFDVHADLLGQFIVQGWEGDIKGEDGEVVEYTPALAAELLRSEPALLVWTLGKAFELKQELDKEHQDLVGKPSRATSGKKTGQIKAKSAE